MKNLLPGLRKFSEKVFPKHQHLFESLSEGQSPHTLMITCSDSRIDPNLVTQTKPGEIFVVRNAGNIIPPYGSSKGGEEAAIEFAIDGLGISNIVVCGHTQCGAMAALMGNVNIDSLPAVKSWLNHAAATKKRLQQQQKESSLKCAIEENVLVQIDNLKTHPAVSAALKAKLVKIYGWIYHFESGSVKVYDSQNATFLSSSEIVTSSEEDEMQRFCV